MPMKKDLDPARNEIPTKDWGHRWARKEGNTPDQVRFPPKVDEEYVRILETNRRAGEYVGNDKSYALAAKYFYAQHGIPLLREEYSPYGY